MKNSELLFTRLSNQYLVNKKLKTAEETVDWFGAIQAQEYQNALFSIGLRMNDASESIVEKAISQRRIIRTWPMRGTLHFVTAKDAPWMLKYLTPRITSKMQSYFRKAELDEKVFSKSRGLIGKALLGNKQLTRNELYKILEAEKISTKAQRGLFILDQLAQERFICFGEKKGKQQTFVLFDEWLPNHKIVSDEEGLANLALKYFQSHGPAQITDFMWWSGLNLKEAKSAMGFIKNKIESEKMEDKEYWFITKLQSHSHESLALLLTPYDEFTIAYKDRSNLLSERKSKPLFTESGFWSSMILNGEIVGTWRKIITKDTCTINLATIIDLNKKEKELFEIEGEKYSKFFGLKSEVKFK